MICFVRTDYFNSGSKTPKLIYITLHLQKKYNVLPQGSQLKMYINLNDMDPPLAVIF